MPALPGNRFAAPAFADMATGVRQAVTAPAGVHTPSGYRHVRGDEFDGPDGSAPNPKGLDWRFDKPYCLRMNLAIGGGRGGSKGIDDKAFPCRMEVDHARMFQRD